MGNEDINKRLCELLGIEPVYNVTSGPCPHCGEYCTGKTVFCNPPIPQYDDFASPAGRIDLLRRMREREDYADFINVVGQTYNIPDSKEFLIEDRFILDNTGSLARAAVEFLTKEVGNEQS